ncbi:glutamyl-tRNA reductase [Parasporobacterium paucivorans]|uniref:Glutamyl-tRNA reductase n=1 Tax=Parasporobacterium paucivorans DSM 15970 TaxID=1122934 RepID=A0A1M6DS44_9FIRM|nr:glutamyl-tRNA reductase [Parasporobacterium paucivorans]SHI76067.1 glutamyl-tRNA reductase [Parasporobacterium paucivorans DSM 15970]
MSIRMIGIDHSRATIEYRELFAQTTRMKEKIIKEFSGVEGITGCVVISTCNRMEIWISSDKKLQSSVYEMFCEISNLNSSDYRSFFVERDGYEAVRHLFYLAGGMKSKIIGEDQILTQVKDAIAFSREHFCTDNVLEVLFRMAVTAAKKVKTEIHLSKANSSIVSRVIEEMKNSGLELKDKKCLVIGNGEVGKLAATSLKEEGASVTMTVRQYKSGVVEIPDGCKRIDYADRLLNIAGYDIVLSATSSPNVTLKYEQLENIEFHDNRVFIDLAVPRDIDPLIAGIRNIKLYDIDSFQVEMGSEEFRKQIMEIENILSLRIQEFVNWYRCKDIIPEVRHICKNAAIDVNLRLEKKIRNIDISGNDKMHLEKSIEDAADKAVNRLMFGLMESVKPEMFCECVEAIKKIYQPEYEI